MGWWSTNIMGGDAPLDFEDEFFHISDVEKFPKSGGIGTIPKEKVEKHLNEFVETIEKDDYEPWIGMQVLAVTSIKVGANIPKKIMKKMIKACDDDSWAKENSERKTSVENLKNALTKYDGTPIVISSKGLFETFADKINNKTQ